MQRKDQVLTSSPESRGATAAQPHRGERRSAQTRSEWLPRSALIPIALPRRFVEGVAWDEV